MRRLGDKGYGKIDERANHIQSKVAKQLEGAISSAERLRFSRTLDGVGSGTGSDTEGTETPGDVVLLVQKKSRIGIYGRERIGAWEQNVCNTTGI